MLQEFLQKGAREIESMEQVRCHLQSLLHLTDNVLPDKDSYDQTQEEMLIETASSNEDDEALMGADRVPQHLEALLSLGLGHVRSRGDMPSSSTLSAQNHSLKDALEREKFRRKVRGPDSKCC